MFKIVFLKSTLEVKKERKKERRGTNHHPLFGLQKTTTTSISPGPMKLVVSVTGLVSQLVPCLPSRLTFLQRFLDCSATQVAVSITEGCGLVL